MRCRSLLQRRIFVATNLQPLYDLCKFSAKNIATIFHKQKRLRKPQPFYMSKLTWSQKLAQPERLELSTSAFGEQHSIQLSYVCVFKYTYIRKSSGRNHRNDSTSRHRNISLKILHPPTVIGTAGNQFRSAGEGNPAKRGYTRHWINQLSSILCFVCTTGMRLFVLHVRLELTLSSS